jgi:hypothetical protein
MEIQNARKTPIGSDFVEQIAPFKCRCSECPSDIQKGQVCLVSLRKGKVQKRVCCEDCRLEFDARFWQQVARNNQRKREGRGAD